MRELDAMRGVAAMRAMRGLGLTHGFGAAAMALTLALAAACGGGDSSGLATLEGAATQTPVANGEEIEPVSEPTAMPQPVSDTTDTTDTTDTAEATATAGVSEPAQEPAEATGSAGVEAEGTAGAVVAAEPGGTTVEASIETEEGAGEEAAEPETADLSDEERLLAFAECMRENGVDFPDPVVEADGTVTFGLRPGGGGGGLQRLGEIGRDPDLPAARDACGGLLEGLAFGPGQGGFDLIELQDALLEFARCMRDNGVDMGDPDLSRFAPGGNDDGQPGGPFGEIDLDDPDFAAAFEVCQRQLPTAGRGGRLGGGG